MSSCDAPVSWEALVAYWAGDLPAAEGSALEEHLFECDTCTAASARVAAITESLRALIPPVVTRRTVDELRAKGRAVRDDTFRPGERREAFFPRDADLLIFHLVGLDLAGAASVVMTMRDEVSGTVLVAVEPAPFDAAAGELLLCCQRHYAKLPPDIVVDVRVEYAKGESRSASYTILHRFE